MSLRSIFFDKGLHLSINLVQFDASDAAPFAKNFYRNLPRVFREYSKNLFLFFFFLFPFFQESFFYLFFFFSFFQGFHNFFFSFFRESFLSFSVFHGFGRISVVSQRLTFSIFSFSLSTRKKNRKG